MPSGTGYIVDWIVEDIGGIIHVCDGDHLVGEDVAFLFEDCSKQLKNILEEGSIHEIVDCPPPANALTVRFDFDIISNEDLARNVDLDP
ncbi:MAG TPA: hypothetical protein VFR78_20650 [Pyrinomonadaceae bacterium]|nr:hypothetical protein [Pyrinomonadaceae bacterium]